MTDTLSTILSILNEFKSETNARLEVLTENSTDLNARLDVLGAHTTILENRLLNKHLDTVSARLTHMADNLLTDVLAAAMPQAIKKVDAHITTITEKIIDQKIDGSIKNGFDQRIT